MAPAAERGLLSPVDQRYVQVISFLMFDIFRDSQPDL